MIIRTRSTIGLALAVAMLFLAACSGDKLPTTSTTPTPTLSSTALPARGLQPSDACDSPGVDGTTHVSGYIGDAFIKLATSKEPNKSSSICFRVNADAGRPPGKTIPAIGGNITVTSPSGPPARPMSAEEVTSCITAAPIVPALPASAELTATANAGEATKNGAIVLGSLKLNAFKDATGVGACILFSSAGKDVLTQGVLLPPSPGVKPTLDTGSGQNSEPLIADWAQSHKCQAAESRLRFLALQVKDVTSWLYQSSASDEVSLCTRTQWHGPDSFVGGRLWHRLQEVNAPQAQFSVIRVQDPMCNQSVETKPYRVSYGFSTEKRSIAACTSLTKAGSPNPWVFVVTVQTEKTPLETPRFDRDTKPTT